MLVSSWINSCKRVWGRDNYYKKGEKGEKGEKVVDMGNKNDGSPLKHTKIH